MTTSANFKSPRTKAVLRWLPIVTALVGVNLGMLFLVGTRLWAAAVLTQVLSITLNYLVKDDRRQPPGGYIGR